MKTQRRQELRTNELDQLLIDANAFFRKNGSYIAIGVILLALVFFGRWYLRSLSATAMNAAYSQLVAMESATDDECRESIQRLKELAAEVGDERFEVEALAVRALLARSRLINAQTGVVQTEFAEEAGQAYQEIIERFSSHALEYGAALMGQAMLEQTLFVEDHDIAHRAQARGYLQRIIDDVRLQPTPLTVLAVERLNALDAVMQPVSLVARPEPLLPPPSIAIPTILLPTPSEDSTSPAEDSTAPTGDSTSTAEDSTAPIEDSTAPAEDSESLEEDSTSTDDGSAEAETPSVDAPAAADVQADSPTQPE